MTGFVRASELYDVSRGRVLPHPRVGATDEDVRRALKEQGL